MSHWINFGPADVDGQSAVMWQLKDMWGEKVNTYSFYITEVKGVGWGHAGVLGGRMRGGGRHGGRGGGGHAGVGGASCWGWGERVHAGGGMDLGMHGTSLGMLFLGSMGMFNHLPSTGVTRCSPSRPGQGYKRNCFKPTPYVQVPLQQGADSFE